ncbi:MVP isoform 8 [Pongo abelii]|uniref:MVP isoform 8 n=1 Tax=Pongo abelii TaxID=9601 RepID=A0A2J8TKA1_PONAB|nr:MVP isoform 8 [Pongo abelii]
MATEEFIIRIPPYHYIHVLDQNSNVSHVEVGPKTYIRQDNERFWIWWTPSSLRKRQPCTSGLGGTFETSGECPAALGRSGW